MQAASPSPLNPAGAGGLLLAVLVLGVGAGRLGGRFGGHRRPDRRGRGDTGRHLRGVPALPGGLLVLGALFSTPRPEPSHLFPAVGSALVIALALPIIAISGWSVAGWGLAA